jgi:hypothetical protein
MSIIPPLDRLTKAPSFGVDKIQQQFNDILDLVVDQTNQTIKDSVKLPTNVKCDDPRVQNIKQNLENIQSLITQVQQNIPKIQSAITAVNTIVSTAQGIKSAIAAAQLANPVTAPVYIATQTEAIQNQLIVNAIEAVKPLQALPKQIESKIIMLMPILIAAISKLNTITDDDVELNVPSIPTDDDAELNVSSILTDDDVELNMDTNYYDLIPTEFYNELNVSDDDLTQRSNLIEQLVDQQRNLLTSLQEAPSQVYKQEGNPPPELGKIGDYYLNTSNNVSYGPKITDTDWGNPLN